jgi:hypothetical protein
MRRFLPTTLLVLGFLGGSANATTVAELSVVDLDRTAEIVVLGDVVRVESFWDGGLIVTETTISVEQCLSGQCDAEVVVTSIGGQVGDIVQQVEGAAMYAAGDRVCAFLRQDSRQQMVTVGMAQGLFHLVEVDGSVLAWADHSGMTLVDRRGELHAGAGQVTYHLVDLIYAVRFDLPVLPVSPAELPQLAAQ